MKFIVSVFLLVSLGLLASCSQTQVPTNNLFLAGIVGGTEAAPTLNGKSLNLAGASISFDGEAADASVVKPGVELDAQGKSSSQGVSVDSVSVNTRVKGRIDTIDLATGTLESVGVQVALDALTRVYKRSSSGSMTEMTMGDLKVGDYAEVYGVPQPDDSVLATRIEVKIEDNQRVEVRMPLRDLDETAQTFSYGLRTLVVDYSQADLRGELQEGVAMRVRGTLNGTTLVAERVRVGSSDDDGSRPKDSGDELELYGPVFNLDSSSKVFNLLSYSVDYGSAEVKGTVVEGARVKVEGKLSDDGVTIVAREVKVNFESGGSGVADGQQEGPVDSIDYEARLITVAGSSFWVDSGTKVERDDEHIDFSAINAGDWVELKFNSQNSNSDDFAYATKIEVKKEDSGGGSSGEHELEGSISTFDMSAQSFTIGTVQVVVQSSTEYEDIAHDEDLSASDFWAEDRTGQQVKVEGELNDGVLSAREIKLR